MKHRNQPKSFSEIIIGDKVQFDVDIDEKIHSSFAELFRDSSPIHRDEKYCLETKFKKKIGYAFMLTGFLSRLYGEYLPGGSSICIKQEVKFIKPFYIGDKITIVGEVVNKIASTQFVEIKTEMYKGNKECIFKGEGVVQILFKKVLNEPLYEVDDKQICYSDFMNSLQKLGIKKGDIVFVHSDVSVFGKLCVFNKSMLLNSLIDVIKRSVGNEGTIIMPTFSYSFCNNEIFDVLNTKSTVGTLTEFFRLQPNVNRTIHPIFSVAIWGKNRDKFIDISKDSFDKGSIFGKLHQMNGKILFLGAPFLSCTYIHYIEQLYGVPYRYMKTFRGIIKNAGIEYEDEYTYFVRYLDREVILDTTRFEKYLLEKGLLKEAKLGNGRMLMIESDTFFKEGCKLLKEDINFFLKKEPK